MTLTATDLTVRRSGRSLLARVSCTLQPGRITAVLGPNGAGKSTLLGVLSGDIRPDAGRVELLGRSLPSWTPRELAQHRAVLPQHAQLAFAFDASAVVAMGRHPHRETATETRAHTVAALRCLGLEDLRARSWLTLSGGERQRVRLARVLAQMRGVSEGVVYLDEPTNHLDLRHRQAVHRVMTLLADQGLAVCCVLHDLDLATQWADDVVLLANGTVRAHGPTHEVLGAEVLERAYGVPFHAITLPGRTRPQWMPLHHHGGPRVRRAAGGAR